MSVQEVYDYLKKAKVFYIATVDGDQPRVRPFGAVDLFEGKIYLQTGRKKNVSQQIQRNGKIEISAMADPGSWIRLEATAVRDDREEAQAHMLEANPSLKRMYAVGDGNTEVLYLKDATASFCSFTEPTRTVRF